MKIEKERIITPYRNYIIGMSVEILSVFILMLAAYLLILLIASWSK